MPVVGAGPVGLYAGRSAWLMGAGWVIVVDHREYRLEAASPFAETYHFAEHDDIVVHLKRVTDHPGADRLTDAYRPMFSAVKLGDAMNKGPTLRMNQCTVKRQWLRLLEHLQAARARSCGTAYPCGVGARGRQAPLDGSHRRPYGRPHRAGGGSGHLAPDPVRR